MPPGPSAPRPATTARSWSARRAADLLTLDEIRPFLVLGFDIRKQPLLDPTLFDLQTLPGPCGAPVATPFSATKGFIVYRSTETLTLEAIAEPGDAVADQFVAALTADEHDGCPPFTETLGGRSTQTSFARSFSLTDLGIHQVGYEQRHAGGSYAHRFVMVVAGGGRVTLLIVLSNDALLPENLHPVLVKAITGR